MINLPHTPLSHRCLSEHAVQSGFLSRLCQLFQRDSGISEYEIPQVPTHGCYEAFTGASVFPDRHSV